MLERIFVHGRLCPKDLASILVTLALGVCRKVGAFREDDEPHGTLFLLDLSGPCMPQLRGPILLQLLQAMVDARLVDAEFAGHEDEAVVHHGRAYDWDLAQRVL